MSYWRSVFIATSHLEGEGDDNVTTYPAIDYINEWLIETGHQPLFKIVNPNPNGQYPECCWCGHYKGLDEDGLVAVAKTAPWRWPEQVQLFIRGEDDRGFVEKLRLLR